MKSTQEILMECGLGQKESTIYLYLLKSGAKSIAKIARNTDLYRADVYKTIESLNKKALIHESVIGKRKIYGAEPPEALHKNIERLSEKISSIQDELEIEYTKGQQNIDLITYRGKEGVKKIFGDVVESLGKGDTFYRYSTASDQGKTNQLLPIDYRKKRDEKKLERFVITNNHVAQNKKKNLDREMKVIPKEYDTFDQDIIQFIYGDKISFIDITQEKGCIIQNKNLADFQEKIFKLLYKKL